MGFPLWLPLTLTLSPHALGTIVAHDPRVDGPRASGERGSGRWRWIGRGFSQEEAAVATNYAVDIKFANLNSIPSPSRTT